MLCLIVLHLSYKHLSEFVLILFLQVKRLITTIFGGVKFPAVSGRREEKRRNWSMYSYFVSGGVGSLLKSGGMSLDQPLLRDKQLDRGDSASCSWNCTLQHKHSFIMC